jgi:anti-sigma-K factor RskA
MIDERHEELASLYALDLLAGEERAQFEAALARDPALRDLVRELRESSAVLAHTAPPSPPPAELKHRILASVESRAPETPPEIIVRPAVFGLGWVVPWAAAAGFALIAAWLAQLQFANRTEAGLLRDQQELATVALKQARTQLEAERLLSSRKFAELNDEIADRARRLADVQRTAAENDDRRVALQTQLAETRQQLTAAQAQLGGLEAQLTDARNQIAGLGRELRSQADLANFKIATLASMLDNSPQALAVAVWNPAKQEGVLQVERLPALAANQSYQLWIVDPQYRDPVDGGVFEVDPASGQARISFKSDKRVDAIKAFAVTRERKGGVPKAEGPFVLLGK